MSRRTSLLAQFASSLVQGGNAPQGWTNDEVMVELVLNALGITTLPTSGGASAGRGTPVAKNGTCNGASQQVAAANATRSYFSFQNPSTNGHSMWVNILGSPAVADNTAIEVQPGQGFVMSLGSFVPVTQINVIGTNAELWHATEA